MRKFAVLRNTEKDNAESISKQIASFLIEKGAACRILDRGENVPEDAECLLVLGGDGTLLRAAKKVLDAGTPLLGINLGTLGYLAEVDQKSIFPSLEHLIANECTIEKRMMLEGTIYQEDQAVFRDLALNDVVITRQGHPRVLRFKNYVNGAFLNEYQADGIILSSATGSTGYSLSAGGPIVSPEAKLLIMTPLAAHTLNIRSIILSSKDRITVEIGKGHSEEAASASVSFDGEDGVPVTTGSRIVVKRASKCTRIVKINNISFLEVLRTKMADT
ncbi:MAG TPA: NAD(+)/NADH kinase [Lachnospiraceae bacterium]|nr:NAD(+)/NADH kinase [Lachnospiraceae bacterium]